jgi:NAD(P)-dependent dehydrogenase (short-subunit alcohol dehydrogenase family)
MVTYRELARALTRDHARVVVTRRRVMRRLEALVVRTRRELVARLIARQADVLFAERASVFDLFLSTPVDRLPHRICALGLAFGALHVPDDIF